MPEEVNIIPTSNILMGSRLGITITSSNLKGASVRYVAGEPVNGISQLTIIIKADRSEDSSVQDVTRDLHDLWMTLLTYVERLDT